MKEITGNVWDIFNDYNALCILTNGDVKQNGECVMGRIPLIKRPNSTFNTRKSHTKKMVILTGNRSSGTYNYNCISCKT